MIGSPQHRISRSQKEANDKQWYKDFIDWIGQLHRAQSSSTSYSLGGGVDDSFRNIKSNYDLYNNIIDLTDFEYITNPKGYSQGELPANFVNRDICSPKIKVLEGMEMKRPFSWHVYATNEEATTRREKEEFDRVKKYVVNQVMAPIKKQLEIQKLQQLEEEPSPDQIKQIQQEVEEESKSMTPIEVRKYMKRDHQDPAEALANQLLSMLIPKLELTKTFRKGFKHLCISARDIYYVGIRNGEPFVEVVNPLYFQYDKSPDIEEVEDGEWASRELRWSPSKVISVFGKELTKAQIDRIYESLANSNDYTSVENFFSEDYGRTVSVLHSTWKALRKIGFLEYRDETGLVQTELVDESYRLNKDFGDIKISWEWIPEVYEGYRIAEDIYVGCGPVEGQFHDLDKLYECKLPYVGSIMDSTNSIPTSVMDRMKPYQYYYDIVMYRLELLLASDKGKILMMNIGMIPTSQDIDVEQFMYYMESSKIGFMNPAEEGNRGDHSIPNAVKEIDMSLASDIQKYINLAEYLERKAGVAVGIPPEAEGQIGPNAAVTNTKQTLIQSSHVLEPIFDLHNDVKRRVISKLLNVAKVAYSDPQYRGKTLTYVLDDMSLQMLKVDVDLLDNSTYGIFVSNSMNAAETKEAIKQLAHAAIQNQKAELPDLIKIMRSDDIQEAEELLNASLEQQQQKLEQQSNAEFQRQQKLIQDQKNAELEKMQFERETELMKIQEKGKLDIHRQTIDSLGYSEDKDFDKDGRLDILEVANQGVDIEIKQRKQTLEEEKFKHQKAMDKQNSKKDNKR